MLHEFPDDKMLLEEIVDLCVISLENPKLGRPWLNRLAKLRSLWLDYTLLSSAEAELENFTKAREYLQIARRLQKEQSWAISPKKNPKRVFTEREDFIKHREWNVLAKKQGGSSELGVKGEKQQMQINMSACARRQGEAGLANTYIGVKSVGGMTRGFIAVVCIACDAPSCAKVCLTNALSPREKGGSAFQCF
ncbi:hypothetical protein M1N62_05405 [Thermodesulfovibrionales bacterium]|nr:hypothetical protein [Thermodesulfovibrionales bacterium]